MRSPFLLLVVVLFSTVARGAGESLPLTDYRLAWLTLHDHPELLTDAHLTEFTTFVVGIEASAWKGLDSAVEYDSRKQGSPVTRAVYEWQKLILSQPDLARGPLLDVFMRPDAPWPFVPHPDSSVVAAFAFARESVEGRQAAFAANELLPVSKQLIQLAAAKVPRDLYFDAPLRSWDYDFAAKAIRFTHLPGGVADVLKPLFDPNSTEPQERQYFDGLPEGAKAGAGHWLGGAAKDAAEVKPGFPAPSPSAGWRSQMIFLRLPSVSVLSLGRQLRIASIPMDAGTAERVQKAGYMLNARIYITAERVEPIHLAHPERVNGEAMVLIAQLQRIDVADAKGQVFATLRPEGLPPPMLIPALKSEPTTPAAPSRSHEQDREDREAAAQARKATEAKERAARLEHMRAVNAEIKACREEASTAPGTSSDRREVYQKCRNRPGAQEQTK